jgi:hypothetical protein
VNQVAAWTAWVLHPSGFALQEKNMNKTIEDTAELETLLADLEPAIVRGQFRAACRRLEEVLELDLERDGPQAGRALIERIHLIAGNRRTKAMNVQVERRGS